MEKVLGGCPAVIYCGTARRFNIAASVLIKHGYAKVFNVLGSIKAWKNAVYEVVK